MKKKIDVNYKKILDVFSPLVSKSEEVSKCLRPMTETVETQLTEPLIRTVDINKIGLRSREIAELVEAGKLERIKQGYYRIVEYGQDDSEAKMIAQLYPDGVLCMTTALFYYGYIDRTPLEWDIAINRNTSKARFNIDYPYVKPYFMEKNHLQYGVEEADYGDCNLKIFNRDRLICECIKHENKMEREIFNKAIQGYINDSKKNVADLLEYAKRRNIHKKIRERISVWL